MSEATKPSPNGSDWTRLLTDPDLVSHLGTLLQTYREVSPERREAALLQAMREIKEKAASSRHTEPASVAPIAAAPAAKVAKVATAAAPPQTAVLPAPRPAARPAPEPVALPAPEPVTLTPPFEPDLFTPTQGSDRRRHHRIKCYFAVEIHVEGVKEPIWGNLSNVGRGGCMVETANPVPPGKALEIGLWISSGKLWVKGVIINGIAAPPSSSSFGVRVKFSETELSENEHLREFLKFVENSTRKAHSGNTYIEQLKS
ncbi:MAG: PilZ domain-containing protein [Terriglobales bacterium]